jgi:hypothetical protein
MCTLFPGDKLATTVPVAEVQPGAVRANDVNLLNNVFYGTEAEESVVAPFTPEPVHYSRRRESVRVYSRL